MYIYVKNKVSVNSDLTEYIEMYGILTRYTIDLAVMYMQSKCYKSISNRFGKTCLRDVNYHHGHMNAKLSKQDLS